MKNYINEINNGVKIIATEGSEILKFIDGNTKAKMDYKGVVPFSMLLNKTVNIKKDLYSKVKTTKDIIALDFTYGYDKKDNKGKVIDKKSKEDIRRSFYKEGFTLNFINKKGEIQTISYKFWFRSASKSRTGACIFVNEKIYNEIVLWQNMGIDIRDLMNEDGKFDIIGWENYRGLTSSHIEGWCDLKPEEILVLSDLDSKVESTIISVDYTEDNGVFAEKKDGECKNTIWDGMMLLDKEKFTGIYEKHGQITLRHHFFKACAFNTNLVQFFKDTYGDDYETATIKDRYGRKVKVKDIRAITTENAMKWEKFLGHDKKAYKIWAKAVKADNTGFGICKTDHVSKYGDFQRMSYQMDNTLPLGRDDIEVITKETLNYIDRLKNDNDFFIEHLKRTANEMNNNNLLIALYKHNNNIVKSYWFKKTRTRLISDFVSTVKAGKLLVNGDNLTVCGNPYMLLQYAVGELNKYIKDGVISSEYEDNTLPKVKTGYSVYTKRFEDGTKLATFRNPHNAPNNIGLAKNHYSNEMETYFNFPKTIMAVNCVGTDCQDRANSMDFDSDFMMVTDNRKVVKGAIIGVKRYHTIVNNIGQHTKPFYVIDDKGNYSEEKYYSNLAEIDINFAKAKTEIGETSNLAQIALSHMWNNHTDELENAVAILSVFAQIAIDGVKRSYDCNLEEEIKNIRNSEALAEIINGKIYALRKPLFWKNTNDCVKKNNIEKVLRKKYNDNKDIKYLLEKKKAELEDKYDDYEKIKEELDKFSKEYKLEWKYISDKDKNIEIKRYRKYLIDSFVNIQCPMNWINDICENIENAKGSKSVKDTDFLVLQDTRILDNAKTRMRAKRLINKIADYDEYIKNINADEKTDDEDKPKLITSVYRDFIEQISKMKIDVDTMNLMLYRALDNDNKHLKSSSKIKTKILNTLFNRDSEMFLSCFKSNEDNIMNEEIEKEFNNVIRLDAIKRQEEILKELEEAEKEEHYTVYTFDENLELKNVKNI